MRGDVRSVTIGARSGASSAARAKAPRTTASAFVTAVSLGVAVERAVAVAFAGRPAA